MTDENLPQQQQTQRRGIPGWKSRQAGGGAGKNRAETNGMSDKGGGKRGCG